MSVPQEVHAAALRAFHALRPDVIVLDLVYDSFVDETPTAPASGQEWERRLAFERFGTSVVLELVYAGGVTTMTVDVSPTVGIEVEVLTTDEPKPRPSLVVRGVPPLRIVTTASGPATVAITMQGQDGQPIRMQTAWLAL